MGKSKTTTETTPWKPAQPYILGSLKATADTFDANQPALQGYASDFYNAYGRAAPGAEAGINAAQSRVNNVLNGGAAGMNPGAAAYRAAMTPRQTNNYAGAVQPSRDYFQRVMGGEFLNGNPYLDANIGYAIGDANNAANSAFSSAGRYGSGAHQSVLAREAGRISNSARMAAYDAERSRMGDAASNYAGLGLQSLGADESARASAQQDALNAAGMADNAFYNDQGRMDQAVGEAQNLRGGNLGLLGNAAQLPWMGVQAQNGGVTQLSSPYSTRTQTSNPGFLGTINAAGQALQSVGKGVGSVAGTAMMLSDPRAKKDVKPLGVRPDGLGVYQFKYKNGMGPGGEQVGVMADEVAANRPDALGPQINGLQTVDYGKLGDLSSAMPAASESVALAPDQLKRRKVGLIGALREDPTLSNPENTRRRLGMALAAASGNPLGEGVMALVQDAQGRMDNGAKMALQRDALALRMGGQRVQRRDGSVLERNEDGDWVEVVPALPVQEKPEPLVQVDVNGKPILTPRSKAAGLPAYRPPPRAASGGSAKPGTRLTAAQRGQALAQAAEARARGVPETLINKRLAELGVQ